MPNKVVLLENNEWFIHQEAVADSEEAIWCRGTHKQSRRSFSLHLVLPTFSPRPLQLPFPKNRVSTRQCSKVSSMDCSLSFEGLVTSARFLYFIKSKKNALQLLRPEDHSARDTNKQLRGQSNLSCTAETFQNLGEANGTTFCKTLHVTLSLHCTVTNDTPHH